MRPGLPVVVRTVDDTDIERLKAAGAAEVVAEIMEGSLMLASTALMLLGVPLNRVLARIRETREQRYSLFRGFFRGITDEAESDEDQPRLHSVVIAAGAAAIGRTLGEIDLARLGVEVTAVRRRNVRTLAPDDETRIEEGDVVVLLGVRGESRGGGDEADAGLECRLASETGPRASCRLFRNAKEKARRRRAFAIVQACS